MDRLGWIIAMAVLDGLLLWVALACAHVVPFPPAWVLVPGAVVKAMVMGRLIDSALTV